MRLRRTVTTGVALALLTVGGLAPSGAGITGAVAAGPADAFGRRIRLARASFDPAAGAPAVPAPFSVPDASSSLWLVQLQMPVTAVAQHTLAATGMSFLGVVPDATYIARGSAVAAEGARALPGVRAVVALQPWFKVAPSLDKLAGPSPRPMLVGTFPDQATGPLAARLAGAGVNVVRVESSRIVTVSATAAQLPAIAADPAVAAVSPTSSFQPLNAIARWTTQSARRSYTPLSDKGLDGSGETAAVADTGLDYVPDKNGAANWYVSDCTNPAAATGCKKADYTYQAPDGPPGACNGSGNLTDSVPAFVPNNNHRKVLGYFNEVAACAAQPGDSGATTHGSHVGGSIAGNRPPYNAADGQDGQAPAAKLAFQDIGNDTESLAGLPNDLYQLFDQAYDLGRDATSDKDFNQPEAADKTASAYGRGAPRVHSNSWGSAIPVVSLGNSPRADDFVANNEDMAIVVAAGNSGPDQASIGEPGTAKDVITSGAMANGDDDFASLDTMANFSSHGEAANLGVLPLVGQRIKPDVATPGLRIVSEKGGTNTQEQVLQGTSMSTPTLAGDALLVRQYFEDGFGPSAAAAQGPGANATGVRHASAGFNPSAALVKAVLVSSAQRMRGAYTGTQGSDSGQNGQWPSGGQGWGRVQLDRAMHLSGVAGSPDLWVQDTRFCPAGPPCDTAKAQGLGTGDAASYDLTVSAGQPLKVVLAWSDPGGIASFLGAGPEALTNQLELQVDGPDGKTTTSYCGNHINTMSQPSADQATSLPDPGGCNPLTDDKANNVQGVYLPHPAAGKYHVRVMGQAVLEDQSSIGLQFPPGGKQGYALAVTGNLSNATPVAVKPASPSVSGITVERPSNDLALVRWHTGLPTTGKATVTDPGGGTYSVADVYSRPADSYRGLELTQVENDGQFLDKPMLSTDHVVKLTGLSPGTRYTLSVGATDQSGRVTVTKAAGAFTTPATAFAPTVASDTATLYSANTTTGPPIPDATDDTWGKSSQFYAGTLPSTAGVGCNIVGAGGGCPPVEALGAFKFTLPKGLDTHLVTGAAVQLFTRHDLTSHVQETPTHTLELLNDASEAQWGTGTSYQQVANDQAQATVGPVTAYKRVPYDAETFTFACSDLNGLLKNLADGQAAFRVTSQGDTLDESLYAWETGFGRRSSGLQYRPRLVLFGANGDPLGQTATATPVISDVRTERLDDKSGVSHGVIHWITDQPSDSVVFVHPAGTTSGYVQVGSPAYVTDHHVDVSGLTRDKAWQFGLRSTTPNGMVTTADNGGKGWVVTDAATKPPGPGTAQPGAGGLAIASVPTERTASPDAVAHGTGRACAAGGAVVIHAASSSAAAPASLGRPGAAPSSAVSARLAATHRRRETEVGAGVAFLALLAAAGALTAAGRRRDRSALRAAPQAGAVRPR
ncbi:MAG: hypothetical protein E6G27_09425 [Actinobacteria bacterium]|nr:MAG: hypothetical protein E6G27_09425 [Actinomycetota bacterium]